MDHKKPIILNDLEEWDFIDYIDSLIQKEETVDLEFKIAKDGLPNSLWILILLRQYRWGIIVLGVKEHKQQFIIEGLTKEQIGQYKRLLEPSKQPDCINENLLVDKDLYEGSYKGKRLLLIYVPGQVAHNVLSTEPKILLADIHLSVITKVTINVRMQKSDA